MSDRAARTLLEVGHSTVPAWIRVGIAAEVWTPIRVAAGRALRWRVEVCVAASRWHVEVVDQHTLAITAHGPGDRSVRSLVERQERKGGRPRPHPPAPAPLDLELA